MWGGRSCVSFRKFPQYKLDSKIVGVAVLACRLCRASKLRLEVSTGHPHPHPPVKSPAERHRGRSLHRRGGSPCPPADGRIFAQPYGDTQICAFSTVRYNYFLFKQSLCVARFHGELDERPQGRDSLFDKGVSCIDLFTGDGAPLPRCAVCVKV